MRTFDTDTHIAGQHEPAINIQRLVVLTDLICLRQVGIKIVLAMKRARLHAAIERQPEPHRQLHRMTVEHRQSAWQTKCDGVNMGVWLITKSVCARTEQLRLGRQLHVHFETNDKFPSVNELLGSGNDRRQVHR